MMKNNIMIILPIVLILDLVIPFILAPSYKGYNHLTQVMSVLGNSKAPFHNVYNMWLIVFGITLAVIDFKIYAIEYYGAAEPPVRCGVSHLSGLTEPPVYSYSA